MRQSMAMWVSVALISTLIIAPAAVSDVSPPKSHTIGGYTLVGKTQAGRFNYELSYKATLTNRGDAAIAGATARLSNLPGVFIVDGQLSFGPVNPRQSVVSTDTFTLRWPVDRAISSKVLQQILDWSIKSSSNAAPIANAGPDQTLNLGATAILNGRASSDPNGDRLSYRWQFLARPTGSAAVLQDATGSRSRFVIDKRGSYTVQLVVNDGVLNSTPDTVVISTGNSPPVAAPGADQTVILGATVRLDGSASSDVDGDALSYLWSFNQKPSGSAASLSNNRAVDPTFLADKAGSYRLQLIVNDGKADSGPAGVTVSTQNSAPVAKAGPDRSVRVREIVMLDGSASSDVDGDTLSYRWALLTWPAGSTAALNSGTVRDPVLTIDKPGAYSLQLVVNDGKLDSAPDTLTLTTENSPPTADAGDDRTGAVGSKLTLDGTESGDVDGDVLSFRWSLTGKPADSQAGFINPASDHPELTLDQPGTYVAQLIVNDGTADSAPDTATISTVNSKPVAVAGSDQNATTGQSVTLDGGGSTDADHDLLSFRWALISTPDGSVAQLVDPLAEVARFTPDRAGDYVAQLIVNDGALDSEPDTALVKVTLAPPRNTAPQITSTAVTAATAGQGYRYDVDATDNDGDTLNYTLTTFPSGMTMGLLNGVIDWTPRTAGNFDVAVDVSDGKGGSATQSFVIQVVHAPVLIDVPNLVGMSRTAATAAIAEAGLVLGGVTEANSDTVATGNVINQSPAAGADVASGTVVTLVVSLGAVSGGGGTVPPDPVSVARPLDETVATTTDAATAFLYSGSNPIQTGVAPGTIDARRVADIRGKVLDKQNNPLPGVTVSILNHPELGQTLSRADGMFDLVVNGGGLLTVNYKKPGYLPAQRQVNVPWQDFVFAEDAVLVPPDSKVNPIDLTDTTRDFQVAQGNAVTDQDGSRQATIIIPKGTQAQVYNPDGSLRPVNALNLRLTEYTVGANGPESMPGPLPPSSAYTYAFEMKADEADVKIAGKDVLFDRPVPFYIDNFLNFPVGTLVPVGYYDKDKAVWVPSDNGKVIKILEVGAGVAEIDSDGDNQADDVAKLQALGISPEERAQLGGLYQAGKTLWRVQVSHLSTWDLNWSSRLPPGARGPLQDFKNFLDNFPCVPCFFAGSIIGAERQTLSEALPIVGTPYSLRYDSDRQVGRTSNFSLTIPLMGADAPALLKRIDLSVTVAGQLHRQSFSTQPNQSTTFTWDGKDAYGRSLQGSQPAFIDLSYVYDATYEQTAAFGENGSGVQISADIARDEIALHQTGTVTLGVYDARKEALGGWTVNKHHFYDPAGRMLYQGDGRRRNVEGVSNVISSVVPFFYGDIGSVGIGADASIYYAYRAQIVKVDPNGNSSVIAGTGVNAYGGDGGQATDAQISVCASKLNLAADGSVVFWDGNCGSNRVRRIGRDGIITTLAGNGPPAGVYVPPPPEGVPGTQFSLTDGIPRPAPDGSIYIADGTHLLHLGTDGLIREVAIDFSAADAGPAAMKIADFAVANDGAIYIMDTGLVFGNQLIRKVTADGAIHIIAGTGQPGSSGDGGPALQARIFPNSNGGIAVSAAGDVYFSEGDHVVRKVSAAGIITQFAGSRVEGFAGDGGPAPSARIGNPAALAFGPDQSLYLADTNIRRVGPPLPGFDGNAFAIPSEDGSELFVFAANGRHLRTVNALTGATTLTFAYDALGRLNELTDGDGNVSRIERDSDGSPIGFLNPYNQRTTLLLNSDGYLGTIANPAAESTSFAYTANGLMTEMRDPESNRSTFSYDASGRLIHDTDAAGGTQTLSRTEQASEYSVLHTTALGQPSSFRVQIPGNGDLIRLNTFPDGTQSAVTEGANGVNEFSDTKGNSGSETLAPDPRWNMQAPYARQSIFTTGGITSTVSSTAAATLSDPSNVLSLLTLAESVTVNGRTYSSSYIATTRTFDETTPAGRHSRMRIDSQGRPLLSHVEGLLDVNLTYDQRGRVAHVTRGDGVEARSWAFSYDAAGHLATVTDPAARMQSFTYDSAGRVLTNTLPDGRILSFGYDTNGNITSVTPPARPPHRFGFTALNRTSVYEPPGVTGGGNTLYSYDADRRLTRISRADNKTVALTYDEAGRLATAAIERGAYTYSYSPGTGQLTGIQAPDGGSLSYVYDGSMLVHTTWSGAIAGTVSRSYDNDFREVSVAVNGDAVARAYDADSLLTATGSLTLTRDPQRGGLLTQTTLADAVENYGYNGFGEVIAATQSYGSNSLVSEHYQRDALGRITQKVETIAGVATTYDYSYDAAGRLVEVARNGVATANYAYDGNSNRIRVARGALVISATYDDQDRLLDYGGIGYTYTANGELVSRAVGAATASTYRYDEMGNLLNATLPGGTVIDYVIDGNNRRIGKKVNGTLEQGFLYQDGLKVAAELDGSNRVISRFIYATRMNVPDYMVKDGVTYRIFTDHLGSPRRVVAIDGSNAGQVAQHMDYDEFGQVLVDTQPGFQPFGFAGGLYDQHTKLVRFGMRDYDAETGRWTAKDPSRFAGVEPNLYGYVANDPVNFWDSSGLQTECENALGDADKTQLGKLRDRYRETVKVLMKREGTGEGFAVNPGERASEEYRKARMELQEFLEAHGFDREDFKRITREERVKAGLKNGCGCG